jgi:hypothetical protein
MDELETSFRSVLEKSLTHIDVTWSPGNSCVPEGTLTIVLHQPGSRIDARVVKQEIRSLQNQTHGYGGTQYACCPGSAL